MTQYPLVFRKNTRFVLVSILSLFLFSCASIDVGDSEESCPVPSFHSAAMKSNESDLFRKNEMPDAGGGRGEDEDDDKKDDEEPIEDETDIVLDPDDPGLILGKEITPIFPKLPSLSGKTFRAMTYNLHLWGKDKPDQTTELVKKAGAAQKLSTAIFDLFRKWGADVVALQEIYQDKGSVTVPFKGSEGNYKVLFGNPIFSTSKGKKEFCAIAYNTSKMSCVSEGTQWKMNREIHWAKCTLKPSPPKQSFYFGCAHFAPSGSKLAADIKGFFDRLYGAATLVPKVNGVKKDDFIVGGDFNSYYHGLQQRQWQRMKERFDEKSPKPNPVNFVEVKPKASNGGFTKIHKRKKGSDHVIKIAKTKCKRIIDDLFWQLKPRGITPISGSKRVVPVTELKNGSWEAFWKAYYRISDHLPVIADFRYR